IQRCGLDVDDVVLEQLASSFAVLTEGEKELGVCLVDIGGGTTDLAVFSSGAIRHTAVIPIAGDQVTNDIAVSMRTPTQYAEDIKIRYACALSQLANPAERAGPHRRGAQPDLFHRRGAAALRARQRAAGAPRAFLRRERQVGARAHAFVVPGQLLKLTEPTTTTERRTTQPTVCICVVR